MMPPGNNNNNNMQRPSHLEMLSPTKMMQPATILKTKTDYGKYRYKNRIQQIMDGYNLNSNCVRIIR